VDADAGVTDHHAEPIPGESESLTFDGRFDVEGDDVRRGLCDPGKDC
jgi:hypothetical protein